MYLLVSSKEVVEVMLLLVRLATRDFNTSFVGTLPRYSRPVSGVNRSYSSKATGFPTFLSPSVIIDPLLILCLARLCLIEG